MAARLKGWRFGIFIGAFVAAISTPFYFTAIRPMMHPEYYTEIREKTLPQMKVPTDAK